MVRSLFRGKAALAKVNLPESALFRWCVRPRPKSKDDPLDHAADEHVEGLISVSRPGRRVYSGSQELPRVMNGLGITIVSTPRGVLSDAGAREQNVGGEVLAEVF